MNQAVVVVNKNGTVKQPGIACGVRVDEDPTVKQELSKRSCAVSLGRHTNKMVCAPQAGGCLATGRNRTGRLPCTPQAGGCLDGRDNEHNDQAVRSTSRRGLGGDYGDC